MAHVNAQAKQQLPAQVVCAQCILVVRSPLWTPAGLGQAVAHGAEVRAARRASLRKGSMGVPMGCARENPDWLGERHGETSMGS